VIESHRFSFGAGALCLDFVNTCGDRPLCSENRLTGTADLAAWGSQAGLLSEQEAEEFIREAATNSRGFFDEAVTLREAVYGTCSALARGAAPTRRNLVRLNDVLKKAIPNLELGTLGNGCCWRWAGASTLIERILWPIARSAADLLTSDDAGRLRECAGDGCSWLFLDRSRNGRRKWCSMSSCGNRAKARRHYAKRTSSG
jgi:predicted RNA-binding Zn ribbon-like protein